MEKDFVRVVYRNERMQPVYVKTYTLRDYTDMLRQDLLRIINDVEDMAYEMNDNADKEDWSDVSQCLFNRIKHKLLDKAGDIGRLPDNIIKVETKEEPLTEYIAGVLNGKE